MDGLIAEIRKTPPITKFLCGSSLVVTLSVLTGVASPYSVFFTRDMVFEKFEIWRLWTSFFLGSGGINYVFELGMLYQASNVLEYSVFYRRSADFAWQLLFACGSIISLTRPLKSSFFSRPLLICLTYISASLAPPGAQSNLMGSITYPAKNMPYLMLGLDLLMGGTSAAAESVVGALVGHLWWWGVWGSGEDAGGRGYLDEMGRAPGWFKGLIGEREGRDALQLARERGARQDPLQSPLSGTATTSIARGSGSGYNWGSGRRLGSRAV
ncbi:DER1-domain-containing protein [Pluteus cervinus]|uniref:DER1-domain-containing protein n=1 Tax=Pluteus cervinus TaxID=181527 RepID=A0ACD3AVT1_9AGAR|nr:DER1-domain-containing protein [Pluteus cervinus]